MLVNHKEHSSIIHKRQDIPERFSLLFFKSQWCQISRWDTMGGEGSRLYIAFELGNRIRPIPPSCPVGNESDTIRVRHEGDSTFGRILIRDTHSCTNRTRSYIVSRKSDTCPKNRTRNLGIANLKFLFSQGFSNKTMIYTTY